MKTNKHTVAAFCAVIVLGFTAGAYAYPDPLPVKQEGNVTYITGGIGEEERDALQLARADYNLHVMNSYRDGSFSGDTHITIFDRAGKQVLTTTAGPLFYANLPAGKYQIVANSNQAEQKKSFTTAGSGQSNLHFVW